MSLREVAESIEWNARYLAALRRVIASVTSEEEAAAWIMNIHEKGS